jgi:hypothetical protein
VEKAEAERIEAVKMAFKKREDADVLFCKVTAKGQREMKVKARKQGREEREISMTIRSFLMEHGVE